MPFFYYLLVFAESMIHFIVIAFFECPVSRRVSLWGGGGRGVLREFPGGTRKLQRCDFTCKNSCWAAKLSSLVSKARGRRRLHTSRHDIACGPSSYTFTTRVFNQRGRHSGDDQSVFHYVECFRSKIKKKDGKRRERRGEIIKYRSWKSALL